MFLLQSFIPHFHKVAEEADRVVEEEKEAEETTL